MRGARHESGELVAKKVEYRGLWQLIWQLIRNRCDFAGPDPRLIETADQTDRADAILFLSARSLSLWLRRLVNNQVVKERRCGSSARVLTIAVNYTDVHYIVKWVIVDCGGRADDLAEAAINDPLEARRLRYLQRVDDGQSLFLANVEQRGIGRDHCVDVPVPT
jgi:hypothetical protein